MQCGYAFKLKDTLHPIWKESLPKVPVEIGEEKFFAAKNDTEMARTAEALRCTIQNLEEANSSRLMIKTKRKGLLSGNHGQQALSTV